MRSLFNRFTNSFRPSYIATLRTENTVWPSWVLWFLAVVVIAIVASILTTTLVSKGVEEGVAEIVKTYPNAEVVYTDDELLLRGVEQPIVLEAKEGTLIVDTEGVYDVESMRKVISAEGGVYVGPTSAMSKTDSKFQEITYTDLQMPDFRAKANELPALYAEHQTQVASIIWMVVALGVLFILLPMLLFLTLVWATVFTIVSRIASAGARFGEVFLVCLFWVFVATIAGIFLGGVFWTTVVVLSVVFYFNFRHLKSNNKPQAPAAPEVAA
jgi:hypothetical protein